MKINSLSSSVITIFFILIITLQACGPKDKGGDGSKEFDEIEGSLKDQIEDLTYNIPPPTDIPYTLQATGAEFNGSLINDKNKGSKYGAKTESASLNLGVYTADIGYLTSYDKTQDAIDYINTCKGLADNLGVIGTFDLEILQRFEDNVDNKDSLASILNQSLKKAEVYLKSDKRNKLAALVITGGFIEGLYIATGLIKTYPKDLLPDDQRNLILTPMMTVVAKQQGSVGEVIKMLSSVDQTEPVETLIKDLKLLQASYEKLNFAERVKNNQVTSASLDAGIVDITGVVEKIRKDITQ